LIVHSTTQSSPDISCRNAIITRAAMQNLDNQIWKSNISIHTKLELYNTCILYTISCTSPECWAVTKRDVLITYALDQWFLWKLLEIKWYRYVRNNEVRRTTGQQHCFD